MSWFGLGNKKTATAQPQSKANGQFKVEPRILRLGWLGMKVADVVDIAVFMEQKLGLRFIEEGNTYAGHHVRYDCGALELELVSGGATWATRSKPRRGQPDVPLVPSFAVDNIQNLVEQLNEKEIIVSQLFEQGWTASFYFFDPERNLWQVHEKRTEAASATDEIRKIGAIWLACEDLAAQTAFYRDVLGLPLSVEQGEERPITEAAEKQQTEEPELSPDAWQPDPEISVSPSVPQQGVVFFESGVRLALSPGGVKLPEDSPRVWGKDTAFLPGLLTNDLTGFTARLTKAGIKITGPYPHIATSVGFDPRYPIPRQAIRFYDPEGHPWQVYG